MYIIFLFDIHAYDSLLLILVFYFDIMLYATIILYILQKTLFFRVHLINVYISIDSWNNLPEHAGKNRNARMKTATAQWL